MEGFSGLLSIDPISGIAGHYMGAGALFRPPRGSPWVRGAFRFEGLLARFFDGGVEVFHELNEVFVGHDPTTDH